MKDFTEAKLRERRFSTPSEYIRSFIRDDQDVTGKEGAGGPDPPGRRGRETRTRARILFQGWATPEPEIDGGTA
jgi:hypothetical protein